MEQIKKILYSICILLLFSCNGQENKAAEKEETIYLPSKNINIQYALQKIVSKDDDKFEYYFKENVIKLILTRNTTFNLSIDNKIFETNLALESPTINVWNFKKSNTSIILIEGDDYYGSVFHVFYYANNILRYYDNINYVVKNVEENNEGKNIDIDFKNQILTISISQNNKTNNYMLKKNKIIPLVRDKQNELTNENNLEVVQEKNADINQDGIQDQIQVFWNKKNANFSVIISVSNKNSNTKKVYRNENLFNLPNTNSTGTGLKEIVTKNNYITFEDNLSEGNPTQNTYTTFVYDKQTQQLYLHKYGIKAMHDDDNSSKDWEKIYNEKDFGQAKFENVTIDFLQNLSTE